MTTNSKIFVDTSGQSDLFAYHAAQARSEKPILTEATPNITSGFHRIRYYGLIANTGCKQHLVKARELLNVVEIAPETKELVEDKPIKQELVFVCPEFGGPRIVKEILICQLKPRAPPLKLMN
jgi:hypothetical protein